MLSSFRLHEKLTGLELLDYAARSLHPSQSDPNGDFGEPPVTLFHNGRLVIDLYPWFSSSTTIHQHGFSGVFCVLAGGSVHTRYSFHERDRIEARLRRGDLRSEVSERLAVGDARPIHSGDALIHGLFHLEHPSFSIVLRNTTDPDRQPQFQYFRNGLAIDPFHDPIELRRPLQILAAVHRIDPARYVELSSEFVEQRPAYDTFQLLMRHQPLLEKDVALREQVQALVRKRWGELADTMLAALEDRRRTRAFNKLREKITDPDHRFLLALLLNVPRRRDVIALVQRSYPDGSAVERLTRWVLELTQHPELGVRFTETQLAVLQAYLSTETDADQQPDPDAAVLEVLARTFQRSDLDRQVAHLRRFRETIRTQTLFSSLVEGT